MDRSQQDAIFVVGHDYHLGDLLWLTAVIRQYRETRNPVSVTVAAPDRDISRILENNPLIDRLTLGSPPSPSEISAGTVLVDLRIPALARNLVHQWRRRWPCLYYRDLWFEPRGQWLATYLGLGELTDHRPVLELDPSDYEAANRLHRPYVVLAPHIGSYSFPLTGAFWRHVKGWDNNSWQRLGKKLRDVGFEIVTLCAQDQQPIPDTIPMTGLPIRQAAGVIGKAAALVSGESGLWFVAAARQVPFVIVPWWLPFDIDWAAPMGLPHRLISRREAGVATVFEAVSDLARTHLLAGSPS